MALDTAQLPPLQLDQAHPAMSQPTGFSYIPAWLSPTEASALLDQVLTLPFERESYRGHLLKRHYAQFGFAYITARKTVIPAPPLPPFLTALAASALPHCPAGATFNQCIATQYSGDADIGWHTDAPCFGDCIIAVSLGAPATMRLQHAGTKELAYEQEIAPGSLYIMSGAARWEFQHQLGPPRRATRHSLTFRSVPPTMDTGAPSKKA